MEQMSIVIVGHIDHGKSTLIGRLLYDTESLPKDKFEEIKQTCEALGRDMEFSFILDHLQEEREQGITIDTTQIFFKTRKRDYVIIDSPGHVEFIKNMITGASQADAAILIVDANEGIKEQTKRHAYILSLLGLDQIIIIVNKMDLVNYSEKMFNDVTVDLLGFLDNLNLKPRYVIPIAAKNGENIAKKSNNMKWYNGKTVLESLDVFQLKQKSSRNLRFPIQDVYKINDKRIYVGRVESGVIKKGEEIVVLPKNSKTNVASVEKFLENPVEAGAGESIGITTSSQLFIERGNVICEPENMPIVTDVIRANVFWMSNQNLDKNKTITMKLATQEVTARVDKIEKRIDSSTLEIIESDSNVLKNNEVGVLKIKTLKPIVIDKDVPELARFVFEREMATVAGGIVIGNK